MKKYLWILMFLILFNACGKVEKEEVNENAINEKIQLENKEMKEKETNNKEENKTEEDIQQNGLMFSTQYTIEDYCHGCYIVSKNDGLLKGVLNKNGKEILPVKYDDIDFLNADTLKNGEEETLYIQTRYENDYTVVDENGKQILDKEVVCVDYWLGSIQENSYYFVEKDIENHRINFYTRDGSFLSSGNYKELLNTITSSTIVSISDEIWISENNYILTIAVTYEKSYLSYQSNVYTILFDKNHQVAKKWDDISFVGEEILNNNFTFYMYDTYKEEYQSYSIDSIGNFVENGIFQENEKSLYTIYETSSKKLLMKKDSFTSSLASTYILGKNSDIKLYKTNNTWKLVDNKGVPLYEERYYECIKQDDCYFLMNENNQLCLIDRDGNKLIDYEYLTFDGRKIYFKGMALGYDNFFVGDDGVSIVLDTEVYFFGKK